MSPNRVLLRIGASGCVSPQSADDVETGSQVQGQLTEGELQLSWLWRDPWDQGVCVDCSLQNMGPGIPGWNLTIALDKPVDEIVYSRGARVQATNNRLVVSNFFGTDLGAGELLAFEFCVEPKVRLEEILEVLIGDEASGDTDPVLYGTLVDQDGTLGLQYRQDGRSNGGDCLDLTVKNLTGGTINGWSADLEMSEAFDLVDSSGLWPHQIDDTVVTLYPDPGNVYLYAFAEAQGQICVDPLVVPVDFQTTLDLVH